MTKRRFLFVMHYPGHLRYFDSVIRMLSARGHHVDLVFDNPDKQAEVPGAGRHGGSVEVLGRMPGRGDVWATVAGAIRGTMDYARYLHPNFADASICATACAPPCRRSSGLGRRTTSSIVFVHRLTGVLATCERAIPSSRIVEDLIRSRRPDAVLVTPLVTDRSPQVDVIKSAQARHSRPLRRQLGSPHDQGTHSRSSRSRVGVERAAEGGSWPITVPILMPLW